MIKSSRKKEKTWVHPPDALLRGHIVYNVKFLGQVDVESAKGTEIIKDAIRKIKFNKQVRRAEGQKPPKVELTVSVDGVAIQEPKTRQVQHKFALHKMSYCADDKSDKRIVTFIAKEKDSEQHKCYVFDSEKCAEEITLTIGQAFDLAYKRFLEKAHKDIDVRKQFSTMQKKVQQLTAENLQLKSRVADLERCIDPEVLKRLDSSLTKPTPEATAEGDTKPEVGRQLENLLISDVTNGTKPSDDVTAANGNSAAPLPLHSSGMPILSPPPPVPHRNNVPRQTSTSAHVGQGDQQNVDAFGQTPFTPTSPAPNPFADDSRNGTASDAFGMSSFGHSNAASATAPGADSADSQTSAELLDLQSGFSSGLSFAPDDFSLRDLDPLHNQ